MAINLTPQTIKELLWAFCVWFYTAWVSLAVKLMPEKFYKSIDGDTVVITGAGSGIGRLMAQRLARKGAKIVTVDVNEKGNEETVKLIRAAGGEAFGYRCDLTKRDDVYKVSAKIKEEHGPVSMLINNAGIVSGTHFLDTPDEKIDLTFKVNILAHFWTLKAFLPSMIEHKKGHIVNIASLAGTTGCSRLVDYCSSKFAAVGLHETLTVELRTLGHDKYIHHTLVCPFFINTGMFDGVANKIIPILAPDTVVQAIVDAILTNTYQIFVPGWLTWIVALKHMMPARAGLVFGEAMGTADSMDRFIGRKKKA